MEIQVEFFFEVLEDQLPQVAIASDFTQEAIA